MIQTSISRQQLGITCRVLRQPRRTATLRSLATACHLSIETTTLVLKTIQAQPFVASIHNAKGTWLSYGFTNYAKGLIHVSFCAVVCEGMLVEGSESAAAPMFNADTQRDLKRKYQQLALDKKWVYLDVAHDHMTHLLDALENCFREKICSLDIT